MQTFWIAFFLIFIAEIGDKTQFMTLALATKYKGLIVLAGVAIGTLLVSLISVILGVTVSKFLSYFWLNCIAGLAFITFGVLELKNEKEDEEGKQAAKLKESHFGPIINIATAFFIAELGDKTMLATLAIATREHGFIQVWLGSSFGLIAANALAIILGKAVGKKLSAKTIRIAISAIYILSGTLAIFEGFHQKF